MLLPESRERPRSRLSPVLRTEPSTSYTNHWISSTNPGLSACCLSQFWPAVILPQWLLLGYFQIYVSIHIPALVFPEWQGDELLGTVTFIFCTHCAVGAGMEWPVKDLPLLVFAVALRLGQPAIYKVQWNAYNFSIDGQAFFFFKLWNGIGRMHISW